MLKLGDERFPRGFGSFSFGHLKCNAEKTDRRSPLECGLAASRDPAFDFVCTNHAILDVVNSVAAGIRAVCDCFLDARQIVRMYSGPKHVVVDQRFGRQTKELSRVHPTRGHWSVDPTSTAPIQQGRLLPKPRLALAKRSLSTSVAHDVGANADHESSDTLLHML